MNEQSPLLSLRSPAIPQAKASVWHAIIIMFLVAMAGGALYAPHIQFYTDIFCERFYEQNGDIAGMPTRDCAIPQVQKTVARVQAVILLLNFGSSLVSAGFYGSLSDHNGRRIVLRISAVGFLIGAICNILVAQYQATLGIGLLFLGPLLRGAMAGDSVLMATVQAYITDCTTPQKRTIMFARVMAAVFIGAAIGPAMAGAILRKTDSLLYLFYVILIIQIVIVLYTLFILPESHVLNDDTDIKEKNVWDQFNLVSAMRILFHNESQHTSAYALPLIAATQFLTSIIVMPPTLLYAMLKFKWTAYESSLYVSYSGFMRLLVMVIVLPCLSWLFLKKVRLPKPASREAEQRRIILFDLWMIRAGTAIDGTSLVISGLVSHVGAFVAAAGLHSFSMLAQPSLRSIMTKLVPPSQVGQLMGAVAVLDSLAVIIAQLCVNTIYSASVATMPSLTFFLCASIAFLACLCTLVVRPDMKPDHRSANVEP